MIINSDALKTRAGPQGLIHHLLGKPEDNESIRLVQGADEMIRFAYDDARVHQSQRAVLHIKLSPDIHQPMSVSDWDRCVHQLAQEYHFASQTVSIIEHQKKGRTHRHLVVPFVDPVTGKNLDLGFSKLRDEKCARLLELSFGHKPTAMKPGHRQSVVRFLSTQGLVEEADQIEHIPDAGVGTSRIAHQKAKRLGRDLADEKTCIKTLFQQADGSKAFQAALREHGYLFQKGEKEGRFIICQQDGALIGSANRLVGLRVKAFQQYMENDYRIIFKENTSYTKQKQQDLTADQGDCEQETVSQQRSRSAEDVISASSPAPQEADVDQTRTAPRSVRPENVPSLGRQAVQKYARNDPSEQQSGPSVRGTSRTDEGRGRDRANRY